MKQPMPYAHRGDIGVAPENTHHAFAQASAQGCCVETDIQLTADGEVVVFHDSDFRRLGLGTDLAAATTPICQMKWEEIAKIELPYAGHLLEYFPPSGFVNEAHYYFPWQLDTSENIVNRAKSCDCNNNWANMAQFLQSYEHAYRAAFLQDKRTAKVMHFREFLNWVAAQPDGFMAEVEYKSAGLDRKVYDMIEAAGVADRCILMSGVPALNQEMQRFAKQNGKPAGLKLAANIRWLTEVQKQAIADWDLYEVGLNAYDYGRDEVQYLAERGILVYSNLGDTPDWWQQMHENGTAAFKTNCLTPYLNWKNKTIE